MRQNRPTRRLKLFNNRLSAPRALCDYAEHPVCGVGSAGGLQEIHLSHNSLRVGLLEGLLEAVARARGSGRRRLAPLWLRVERNEGLPEAARHITEDAKEFCGLRLCFDGARQGYVGCGPHKCKHGAVGGSSSLGRGRLLGERRLRSAGDPW
ncbi:unnamed protein product [Prorocentrum cordatum]|uniref:Uncharacterized protein n=1 Tax=Prorocentrum cordatum TaxID=2364126 RepID=A0ABN9SQI1_9DINO|nr:unnamed protein product [Polarella glacialis]